MTSPPYFLNKKKTPSFLQKLNTKDQVLKLVLSKDQVDLGPIAMLVNLISKFIHKDLKEEISLVYRGGILSCPNLV